VQAEQTLKNLDFALVKGAVISGRVMAADDGTGIADVPIGVYGPAHPRSGAWVQTTKSAADGSYSLRVPPGEQYVYYQSYQPPAGFSLPQQANLTVTVAEGQTLMVDFKLPRIPVGTVVKGQVVDEQGKAVARAKIFVYSMKAERRMLMAPSASGQVSAGDDGRFELKLDGPARLRARNSDGLATAEAVEVGAADKEVLIRVRKKALASISGHVVDSAGKAVADASIQLIETNGTFGMGSEAVRTGKDGVFHVDSLWADGNYSMDINSEGRACKHLGRLRLTAGEEADAGFIVLKDLDSFIKGTITENGKPAVHLNVILRGNETPLTRIFTNDQGQYEAKAAANDKLFLYFRLNNGKTITRRTQAGEVLDINE
jgi:hypothetical protein